MIPVTPHRSPVQVHDSMATYILRHAPAELAAPPRPRIVDERCGSNLAEKAVFDAVNYLTRLHAESGRKDFTIEEISRYAAGVSRGRIAAYLRSLCDKELLDVTGHRPAPRLPHRPDRWPARYAIDHERLLHLSVLVVADDIRREAVVIPTRPRTRVPDAQLGLAFDGLDAQHPAMPVASADAGHQHPTMLVPGADAGHQHPAMLVASADAGHQHPAMLVASADAGHQHPAMLVAGADAGDQHPAMLVPGADAGHQHPAMPVTSIPGCYGREVSKRVGEREREAAHAASGAPTHPDSLALLIRDTIQAELASIVAELQRPLPAFPNGAAAPQGDEVPASPAADEPPVANGLLESWRIVIGCDAVPARDEAQLRHLVARYDRATNGHAAYWLVRAMLDADRARDDASPPVSLRLVAAYLHRMEAAGEFSTRVLENPKLGRRQRQGDAPVAAPIPEPAPEPAAPAAAPALALEPASSAAPAVAPASEPAPVRGRAVPPAAPTLPADLESAWAVAAWRRYAGPKLCLTPERAQQVIRAVSRPEVWDVVLANWAARERPNWTNLDALVEIYAREAAAQPSQVTADAYDPDGPPASDLVVKFHPTVPSDEIDGWFRQVGKAASPGAKQAVIRRFLAAHPVSDEANFFAYVRRQIRADERH